MVVRIANANRISFLYKVRVLSMNSKYYNLTLTFVYFLCTSVGGLAKPLYGPLSGTSRLRRVFNTLCHVLAAEDFRHVCIRPLAGTSRLGLLRYAMCWRRRIFATSVHVR